jgi:DNA-binding transcriptional regulator GbsR (MarR family)
MQNMSNGSLSKQQRHFIDELAMLLMSWGMPITAARLYGYLHLQDRPVSLDDITADLEVSKSNACAAAKLLETHGNARRQGERGSKRVLYVIGDDPGTTLRRQTELLGMMSELIAERKDEVAEGPARERLARLSAFHKDLRDAMLGAIQAHRQHASESGDVSRKKAGAAPVVRSTLSRDDPAGA